MTETSEYPAISLGGKQYPVRPLVWRQLRIVTPAFSRLRGKALDRELTEEMMDDLSRIVYTALSPLQIGLTYEQFIDLPITHAEMLVSLSVIVEQAGMKKADGATGEAQSPPLAT